MNSGTVDPRFWETLSDWEWLQFAKRDGVLTVEQCARMFRMSDIQEEPREVRILFNRADIKKLKRYAREASGAAKTHRP